MTKSERETAHRVLRDAMRVFDDPQCQCVDVIAVAKKQNMTAGMALQLACNFALKWGPRTIKETVAQIAPMMLDAMLDNAEEQQEKWAKFLETKQW